MNSDARLSDKPSSTDDTPGSWMEGIASWIENAGLEPIFGRKPRAPGKPKSFEEECPPKLLERLKARQKAIDEGKPYREFVPGKGFVQHGALSPLEIDLRIQERERSLRAAILAAGVPKRMVCANFDFTETGAPLIVRPPDGECVWNQRGYSLCRQIVEKWKPIWNVRYNGLILASPGKGSGKTYLMYAVIVALIRGGRAKCQIVKTGELLDRYRESFRHKGSGQSALQIFEQYANAQVLLIDDMGAESIRSDENGDWAREQFFKLLDWRYERRMTTLATTNLTKEQLRAHYGERTVSRLLGLCAYVVIDGPDYRQEEIDANDEDVDPFYEMG